MNNFLFLTGGNNNSQAYQLFAAYNNKGGETAGSVARNISSRTSQMGGETAGSIASASTTGCCGSSSSSCSFSAIA